MNKLIINGLCYFLFSTFAFSQSINDLISQVDLDTLSLKVQEFSGEIPTVVNGNTVTIINRQSNNNDVAADYIKQEFQKLNNLTITDQVYSANGRNIIATQLGKTNPNNIYIVCAHYDSLADYCADDNASGTIAVLEIARILSAQCLDNTIVYALWDQEENGLLGSNFYAMQAFNNGDNILGVLNIDMMGYDGDDNNEFDIDVRPIASSIAMKDDIIDVLNTPAYGFTLGVNVVNPGTTSSDHSRFWNQGYSAVLVGEEWSANDQTPFYHTSADRFSTLNLPYYHELTKLILAYMTTKGGLVNVTNAITATTTTLTAVQSSASYQWFNDDTNAPISGAINQSFMPISNGSYSVEVTVGTCTERSPSYLFNTLGVDTFADNEVTIHPNPVKNELQIVFNFDAEVAVKLFDVTGKEVLSKSFSNRQNTISLKDISSGVYLVKISTSQKSRTYKIIKD